MAEENLSSNEKSPLESNETNIESKNIFASCFSLIGKTSFCKRERDKRKNTNYKDSQQNENKVNVEVYSINISKIFESNNTIRQSIKKKLKLKRFNDLVHTICALYDNALPDIGPNSVYECISSQKSYSIMVVTTDRNAQENEEEESDRESLYNVDDCLSKLEEENPESESLFKNLFSETEDDSDEEDDKEDEEENVDFTQGLRSFLAKNSKSEVKDPIIKNLIACTTLQRCITFPLPGHEEWVIDLQLMGVRKNYRGFNIGKYLVNLIQNRNYVKKYDAIVTSSDLDAILFYEKYGFSKDPILNSKYSGIGDIWTNTTKMCYIPPYASLTDTNYDQDENSFISELAHMEKDFKRWQKICFGAYQSQTAIFNKFKQEIFTLKAKLCAKDGIIDDLNVKNDLLTKKNKALSLRIENYEIEEFKHDNDQH